MGVLKELFDKAKAISEGGRRVDFALGGDDKKPEGKPDDKPKPAFKLVHSKKQSPKRDK